MSARVPKAKDDGQPAPSFESALKRLETIVQEMEDGALSLDNMIARFEEGQKLVKLCTDRLNEVEKKVEMLVKKGAEVEAVPFEAEGEAAETGGEVEPPRSGAKPPPKDVPF